MFEVAKATFIIKLIDCGHSEEYIEYLKQNTMYVVPHNAPLRRPFSQHKPHVLWLVMPFHPVWERGGLKSIVARFGSNTMYRDLLCEAFETTCIPDIRVAWKISSIPFGGTLVKW